MAHDRKDIQRRETIQAAAAGRVVSHHVVVTDDAKATVMAAGYLNASRDKLAVGDQVTIHSDMGGTPKLTHAVVTAAPQTTGNVTLVIAEAA